MTSMPLTTLDVHTTGTGRVTPTEAIRRVTAAVGLAQCAPALPAVTLDLSCREGELLEQVRLLCPTTTMLGTDPWEKSVLAARRRLGPHAEICQINGEALRAERLPSLRAGIDLALSCLAISSATTNFSTLASVINRLKVGGRLYITDLVPPRDVREHSKLLSLAAEDESRDQLSSLASAAIGPAEVFGLLADASSAAGRLTSIRVSTGGLGGYAPDSPQAQQLAADPRVQAGLESLAAVLNVDLLGESLLHAHVVREA